MLVTRPDISKKNEKKSGGIKLGSFSDDFLGHISCYMRRATMSGWEFGCIGVGRGHENGLRPKYKPRQGARTAREQDLS